MMPRPPLPHLLVLLLGLPHGVWAELSLDSLFRPAGSVPVVEAGPTPPDPAGSPQEDTPDPGLVSLEAPPVAEVPESRGADPRPDWEVDRVGVFALPPYRTVQRRDRPATPDRGEAAAGNPLGIPGLPSLPPLGFSESHREHREPRPLWVDRGRGVGVRGDSARVRVANPTRELLFRYVLEPGEGGDPLVFLLGPEQEDRFHLPPGEWAVTREVWRADTAPRRITHRYPALALRAGQEYELPVGDTDVRRLNRELDLMARAPRF